jgi:hypothetical protein
MARTPAFTSKEAFKNVTWAVKDALPNSIKVAPIRDAIAKFEGFNSANEYMDFLDGKESSSRPAVEPAADLIDINASAFAAHINKLPYIEPILYLCEEDKSTKSYSIEFYFLDENELGEAETYHTELPFGASTFREAVATTRWLNQSIGFNSYQELAAGKNFGSVFGAKRKKPSAFGFATEAEILEADSPNPYQNQKLRDILLYGDSGGCVYLQELVAHLYNSEHKVHLPGLINGTDQNYFKYAMDMIAWYRRYGESDEVFMDVARTVVWNKRKAKAFREGFELARDKAQFSEYGNIVISHQEFRKWKSSLLDRIAKREIRVETNCDDKGLAAELLAGVQRYEDVTEPSEWK